MREIYHGTELNDNPDQWWDENVHVTAWLYGGNDYFAHAAGTLLAYGGDGNDYIESGRVGGTLYGGNGHDYLRSEHNAVFENQDHVLNGGAGDDDLHSSDWGLNGRTTHIGGGGVDSFSEYRMVRTDSSPDRFEGGAGFDFVEHYIGYQWDDEEVGVVVDLTTGTGSIQAAGNTYSGIEGLAGGVLADRLTGNAAANVLMGGWGADYLNGADGNDLLMGAGFDGFFRFFTGTYRQAEGSTFRPAMTNSYSYTDSSAFDWEWRQEEASSDTLIGGNGNDVLIGGGGGDRLDGGAGIDTASYVGSWGVYVDLGARKAQWSDAAGDILISIENLVGSDWIDTLIGDSGANHLRGRAGNDTVDGAAGADRLDGEAGADMLYGGDGNDRLDGGLDTDRLEGGAGNDIYVLATSGDTVVEVAGAGTDTVRAGYSYSLGSNFENLILTGTSGFSGTGNPLANRLTGNAAANTLSGLGGNDILNGGGGNDVLRGGAGRDTLKGGAGSDDFVFLATSDSGPSSTTCDVISGGFSRGYDDIMVSNIDANTGLAGNQAFVLDANGTFSAGEIRQKVLSSGLLLEFNIDSDSAVEMAILVQGLTAKLAGTDFVL